MGSGNNIVCEVLSQGNFEKVSGTWYYGYYGDGSYTFLWGIHWLWWIPLRRAQKGFREMFTVIFMVLKPQWISN